MLTTQGCKRTSNKGRTPQHTTQHSTVHSTSRVYIENSVAVPIHLSGNALINLLPEVLNFVMVQFVLFKHLLQLLQILAVKLTEAGPQQGVVLVLCSL